MSSRKAIATLGVLLCIFLIGACATTAPPDLNPQTAAEDEELVAYQEEQPDDIPYDDPEEPDDEPEEEPEEETKDDEPEEEAYSSQPEKTDDAGEAQQQQQQPAQQQAQQQPVQQQEQQPAQQQAQQQQPAQQQEQQPAQQQAQQQPVQQQAQQQPAQATAEVVAGSDFELEVIRLVNAQRQSAGLSSLTANSLLMRGARIRAEELDRKFSHDRPYGSGWQTVLSDVGYPRAAAGENIAAGQASPSSVVNAWMGSQGHRANILNSAYTEIGVGAVVGSDGRWHWVQLFGGAGAAASGGGTPTSQGQGQSANQGSGSGTTWAPPRAQYSISAPSSGYLMPGDVLELMVITSDPSVPFSVSWSAARSNSWWSFRDGVIEIFDYLGPGTPSLNASVTVFESGNPVAELSVSLNFSR